ncbi:hypothetical protein OAU92_00380 [Acidimicrobiia bacterium]|nr:hypothetical protein [Acidimicrobiia bacterium]
MNSFQENYYKIAHLFDEGSFEDINWRNQIRDGLITLHQLWPDKDNEDIAHELNDWAYRVEQIKKWAALDSQTVEKELEDHGSLFFLEVQENLSEKERNQILEKFWELTAGAITPNSSTIFKLTAGKLKSINIVRKQKLPKTKTENIISELNKIKKHHWKELFELSEQWEIDDNLSPILKSLSKPKSKIKKKDVDYLIDILRYLIDKQYIYTSENVDNTQITQKLVFNIIIQILDA